MKGPHPGLVDGFAFRPPEREQEHKDAYKRASALIDRKKILEIRKDTYGRTEWYIAPAAVREHQLSNLEILTLVNGGPAPFGGIVELPKVTIYND